MVLCEIRQNQTKIFTYRKNYAIIIEKLVRGRTMKQRDFITIPIENRYYGRKPFKPGKLIMLTKDKENEADNEAIKVSIPGIDIIGYVANSVTTVYSGTLSAGRLYDKFDEVTYAVVAFVTRAGVIAGILEKDEFEGKEFNEIEALLEKEIHTFYKYN